MLLRPVDLGRLESLARRFPRTLVRMKGPVLVPDQPEPFEVQWTAGHFVAKVRRGPVAEPYLVAIGRRLVWDRFFDGLDACLARKRRPAQKADASRRKG